MGANIDVDVPADKEEAEEWRIQYHMYREHIV